MLAAMTADARRRFNNRVNLVAGGVSPWTVPAGVTSVNVFAAATGGLALGWAGYGTNAGGGGAAILNVPLTVIPGNVLTYSTSVWGSGWSAGVDLIVTDTTAAVELFRLGTGDAALTGTFPQPGGGGSVTWTQGTLTTANGGAGPGSTLSGNGSNGQKVALAGGWLLGGGGGGSGAILFPAGQGGTGGSSGDFLGIQDPSPAGGGGGGFIPGQYYIGNLGTGSSMAASFIFLEWN